MKIRLQFKLVARTLLYIHCAALVTFVFLFHPGINNYEKAMFGDMIQGKAYRPYVYRVLVPYTVRFVDSKMPQTAKVFLRTSLNNPRLAFKLGWEAENTFAYFTVTLIIFLSFLAFAFTLRGLTLHFYPDSDLFADFAPAVGLLVLPSLFRYSNHIYDPATLLLTGCAILYLARRHPLPYYLFFVLAVANKETAILLVPFFVIAFRGTMATSKIALRVGLQILIFATIRGAIFYAYSANPGDPVEFHLSGNVSLLQEPGVVFYLIVLYVVAGYLVGKNWNDKHPLLRFGVLAVLVPLVLLSVFFGNLDEPRAYYEAYPFVFLLSLHTIIVQWKAPGTPVSRTPG